MKRIVKALAYTVATLMFAVALVAAYVAGKIALYEQTDDDVRMQSKADYLASLNAAAAVSLPNIVFILYDDMGYADLGVNGSSAIKTPQIDQLAADGIRLTNFYSPSPICTPSRFGFLTGRHAERARLSHVVFPEGHFLSRYTKFLDANIRMPAHEITLAEVLKSVGYTTGMVGKWHLGDTSPSLPNDMGFDYFYGALYSNDMLPFALYQNREIVVESPVDQTTLSERYETAANRFIQSHSDGPFFLYLPHNFPHEPLHVRESRLGASDAGLYGDVVEELDEDVGSVIAILKERGVLDNTLVIVTSDNGPWFLGDAGDQRGRKGDTFEGGMKVPFIAHWPARIPAGQVSDALAMGTDLLPTVLAILGLPAPADRKLDGKSVLEVLTNNAPSPHDYLYYFSGNLLGIRDRDYKFVPRRPIHYGMASQPLSFTSRRGPYLFDMRRDGREAFDLKDAKPEVMQQFLHLYELKQQEMAFNREGWIN